MDNLKEVVGFYLSQETSYALMITGEWGIGKTHYFKTVISKSIEETKTYGDDRKTYKPVIVSLFGLKSIEEIQAHVFLSIYPLLANKFVQLGVGVGKILLKGILKLKGLGEIAGVVDEASKLDKKVRATMLSFDDLVICFDDLERMSPSLRQEELIGFINTLVDESAKVIIIANEDKIVADQYHQLKDKVVGNTIVFNPDIHISYSSLIDGKYEAEGVYLSFLRSQEGIVSEVFLGILRTCVTCPSLSNTSAVFIQRLNYEN